MEKTATSPQEPSELISQLFKAGAHFGYGRERRHPSVASYIFGAKNGVDILNLEQVEKDLGKTLEFVEKLGKEGKKILFVGNKTEVRSLVQTRALSLGMPYVTERWVGGTFTNFTEIKKRIQRMKDLREGKARDGWAGYTKGEKAVIQKELDHLERFFKGIEDLASFPHAILVIDSRHEHTAVEEARRSGIPVISLSGSDCDVSAIDYPVVANDSASTSVALFLDAVSAAYKRGLSRHEVAPASVA